MAKNDKKKVEGKIQRQIDVDQSHLNNLRTDTLIPQNQNMWNNYQGSVERQNADYDRIMNEYMRIAGEPGRDVSADMVNYNRSPEMDAAMRGYRGFADTGGWNEQEMNDMRARGISPIRAIYANAANEMTRQRNIAGGYMPNAPAALAKMRNQTSQEIADRVQNVNAGLAESVRQGKLAGLGGLGSLASTDSELAMRAGLANQSAKLSAAGMSGNFGRMGALNAAANLYGTTPGQANMFGNQVLQSTGQRLQGEAQQQQLGQNLFNNQFQAAHLPSNFETGLGRVGQIGNMAAGMIAPFMMPGAGAAAAGGGMGMYGGPAAINSNLSSGNPLLRSRRLW